MGSVICRECGTRFEGKAFVCPNCKAWRGVAGTGAQPNAESDGSWLQAVALVLMALTLLATLAVALFWPDAPQPVVRHMSRVPHSDALLASPDRLAAPPNSPGLKP